MSRVTRERDEYKVRCERGERDAVEGAERIAKLERQLQGMDMDRHMAIVERRHEKEKAEKAEAEFTRSLAASETRHEATR